MEQRNLFLYHFFFTRIAIISWILSMMVICYMSLVPRLVTPIDFSHSDKVWHALAYLWVSLLPFIGFENKRSALYASLLMIALGLALEFGQYFIPERDASIGDLLANIVGVVLGILLGSALRRFYPRYSI